MRWDGPGGTRAARGAPSVRRVNQLLPGALVAAIAVLVTPAQMLAAGNVLSNGSVTPTSGTVATTFAFAVDYASGQGFAATAVWAEVAGTTVTLALVSGSADDGTFSGSSSLPAGSWPVTFRADAVQGSDPTLAGPTLTVIDPNATPPPTSTPRPTPRPSPTPRPTAAPTVRPPPPPTQGPVPSAPAPSPSGTVAPDGTPRQTPGASGSTSATPTGQPSSSAMARSPASSPEPSAQEPDPTDDASTIPRSPWLLVGSGMSAIGAAILAGQWARRRRHRPTRL